MKSSTHVLQVALDTPLESLFDYLPPAGGPEGLPGQRVRVPFGRRQLTGIIVGCSGGSALPPGKLRRAIEIIDAEPLLDASLLELLRWAAAYYQHPPGEVFAAALPGLLRRGACADPQVRLVWELTDEGRSVDTASLATRAAVQARLLDALRETAALDATGLRNIHPGWRKIVATLEARGWVAKSEQGDVHPAAAVQRESGPELTAAQAAAVAVLPDTGFSACLLEGVTGSGKTEVYLQLLEKQIAQGRQSMVLVPEIGLTPQLVERFRRRLSGKLAVMHSGLNETERAVAWLAARSGEADVIVGTRSAVFAPLARPGLLIIDEEHDSSFKQQEGFRYSARDIAVYRARQLDIPVLLGSATPAFESLNNAIEGRYLHAALPERPGNASQPEVRLIDLRQHAQRDGLSQPFIDAMRRHLEADGQALVYLNRRGFAPALLCVACGTTADCRRCDARMVVHQHSNRLICHHCGNERPAPSSCADCGAELVPIGQGTERIEQALRKQFPEFELVRIDRDTTRRKGELARLLDSVRSGESRILLGTQMLTKGHDFPDVSFVGIVDSDQGLFGTDFRSSERLAQSILQVAGRAGRAERAGEVWIQSYYPDHPLLRTLLAKGYRHFAEEALPERRAAGWPPFAHLALLRGECQARDALFRFLGAAADSARTKRGGGIQVLGPASSPMEKRAGRFHGQLLIRSEQRPALQRFLVAWKAELARLPEARKVRWSVDVDPLELF